MTPRYLYVRYCDGYCTYPRAQSFVPSAPRANEPTPTGSVREMEHGNLDEAPHMERNRVFQNTRNPNITLLRKQRSQLLLKAVSLAKLKSVLAR